MSGHIIGPGDAEYEGLLGVLAQEGGTTVRAFGGTYTAVRDNDHIKFILSGEPLGFDGSYSSTITQPQTDVPEEVVETKAPRKQRKAKAVSS